MYNETIIRFDFAISGIIKVSVSVISRSRTVTSTLIIPDIAKTSANNCLLADR